MVRIAARIFGIVFLLIGILGFFPVFTPNNNLLGIFEVNTVHNLIHILSGLAALAGSTSYAYSRLYFQVFGVVYGLVTLLGVFYGNSALLGIVAHNVADIFLHAVITAGALYLGFGTPRKEAATSELKT
jgi:uncharacterized membrane protein